MNTSESRVNSTTQRDCSCRSGFKEQALNTTSNASSFQYSFSCLDVDECVEANGGCGFGMTCQNTEGSFRCSCMSNYVQVDDNTTLGTFHCEDRNECEDTALNNCDANARCNNTVGSFACQCNSGYYDVSSNVTGINGSCLACAPATYSVALASISCASCPLNATSPTASTSRANCTCNAGYAGAIGAEAGVCVRCDPGFFSGPGQTECCACAAGATSMPASTNGRECFCAEGFYGTFDAAGSAGSTNSCDTAGLLCAACPPNASSPPKSHLKSNCSCINGFYEIMPPNATEGTCTKCGDCESGYGRVGCVGPGNAGRCEDINECSSTPGLTPIDGLNNCDPNARCFNLNTTFKCICREGFYGNGTLCK